MSHELPYAIKDGEVVSISEVPSGLKCNCICPSCGADLVARKGNIKIHHFAHRSASNCNAGFETSIHIGAKDLIRKLKTIRIPSIKHQPQICGWQEIALLEERNIQFDRVEIEKRLDRFQPDLIGYIEDKPLLIEIAVTHFIDNEKLQKIKESNISCIEIDLSTINKGINDKLLEDYIIKKATRTKWIHNAKFQQLKAIALNKKYLDSRKEWQREIENWRFKKEQAKKTERLKSEALENGWKVIGRDDDGYIFCEKRFEEAKWHVQPVHPFDLIRKGAFWNRIIYGNPVKGEYVFVNGKKIEIEDQKQWGRFKHLVSHANDYSDECHSCRHFGGYTEPEEYSIICKWKNKADNKG